MPRCQPHRIPPRGVRSTQRQLDATTLPPRRSWCERSRRLAAGSGDNPGARYAPDRSTVYRVPSRPSLPSCGHALFQLDSDRARWLHERCRYSKPPRWSGAACNHQSPLRDKHHTGRAVPARAARAFVVPWSRGPMRRTHQSTHGKRLLVGFLLNNSDENPLKSGWEGK
jgi:hypothetical protein